MDKICTGPTFTTINNILYKVKEDAVVPVIPQSLVPLVLKELHDAPTSGHLGIDKTLARVSSRAYFPKMKKSVADYIRSCHLCQRVRYDNRKQPGLMRSSPTEGPWDSIYMDLMGPYTKSSPGGYTFLLVVIDGFSKWVEIFPLRNALATTIGKLVETQLFCRFGSPHVVVSDNGTNFSSQIINYLCAQWGVTSPHHPQSNLTERANRTVKQMIRTYLADSHHKNWCKHLPFLQCAINSAVHESTGFSPA